MKNGVLYAANRIPKLIGRGGIFVKVNRGRVPIWVPEYPKNRDGSLVVQPPEVTLETAQGLRQLVDTASRGWLIDTGIVARFLEPSNEGFPTRLLSVTKQAGHTTIVAGAQNADEVNDKIWRFGEQQTVSSAVVSDALSGIILRQLSTDVFKHEEMPPTVDESALGILRGIFTAPTGKQSPFSQKHKLNVPLE